MKRGGLCFKATVPWRATEPINHSGIAANIYPTSEQLDEHLKGCFQSKAQGFEQVDCPTADKVEVFPGGLVDRYLKVFVLEAYQSMKLSPLIESYTEHAVSILKPVCKTNSFYSRWMTSLQLPVTFSTRKERL